MAQNIINLIALFLDEPKLAKTRCFPEHFIRPKDFAADKMTYDVTKDRFKILVKDCFFQLIDISYGKEKAVNR